VPLAILVSGIIVLALYFFATAGILKAIPASEIDIVDGLIDTLALFTFFSNGATWAMGCNRTTAEAAAEGQLPGIFAVRGKKHGGPKGAALCMGVVCSLALILYGGLANSNEDLFWSLFSFSAVIFMLPYIGMVLAFLKLRLSDPESVRPFRLRGGPVVALILTGLCVFVLIATIFLFVFVPGEGLQWPTIWGVIAVLLIGEGLMRISRART